MKLSELHHQLLLKESMEQRRQKSLTAGYFLFEICFLPQWSKKLSQPFELQTSSKGKMLAHTVVSKKEKDLHGQEILTSHKVVLIYSKECLPWSECRIWKSTTSTFVVKYYKNYTLLAIMKCLRILIFFFYIFYYCQIRRGCRQNGSFLVLQKPLLVHICVMVWTLFIVFSFCLVLSQ